MRAVSASAAVPSTYAGGRCRSRAARVAVSASRISCARSSRTFARAPACAAVCGVSAAAASTRRTASTSGDSAAPSSPASCRAPPTVPPPSSVLGESARTTNASPGYVAVARRRCSVASRRPRRRAPHRRTRAFRESPPRPGTRAPACGAAASPRVRLGSARAATTRRAASHRTAPRHAGAPRRPRRARSRRRAHRRERPRARSPNTCSERSRTVRPGGSSRSSAPVRSVPWISVPVTIVPRPGSANTRSTGGRRARRRALRQRDQRRGSPRAARRGLRP